MNTKQTNCKCIVCITPLEEKINDLKKGESIRDSYGNEIVKL